MKVVGIIGGGQLGMYLALAASKEGFIVHVYDEVASSASKLCDIFVQGSYNDKEKLEAFCQECDYITYEFENINSDIIDDLSNKYNIVQKSHMLKISSSRYNEKLLAKELDIKTIDWQLIQSKEDKINIDYPYIMKTTSLGYDGKGQYVIEKEEDLDHVDFTKEYLCESKLAFDYEISVIGIRDLQGNIVLYKPFYNIHRGGILFMTLLEDINESVTKQANDYITKIMESQNVYGILTVEFFVKDDVVYFNEIAPRPHNSGHITMDTHYTSQYQNLIRSITGLPLGSVEIKCQGMMVNILGQDVQSSKEAYEKFGPSINYYDYRKEARLNRKVGHLVDFDLTHKDYYLKDYRKEN